MLLSSPCFYRYLCFSAMDGTFKLGIFPPHFADFRNSAIQERYFEIFAQAKLSFLGLSPQLSVMYLA